MHRGGTHTTCRKGCYLSILYLLEPYFEVQNTYSTNTKYLETMVSFPLWYYCSPTR
jgi:hypothetical protein